MTSTEVRFRLGSLHKEPKKAGYSANSQTNSGIPDLKPQAQVCNVLAYCRDFRVPKNEESRPFLHGSVPAFHPATLKS